MLLHPFRLCGTAVAHVPRAACPQSDVDEALRLMKVSQISIASDLEARERADPISEMYLSIMAAAQRAHKSELSFDEVGGAGVLVHPGDALCMMHSA